MTASTLGAQQLGSHCWPFWVQFTPLFSMCFTPTLIWCSDSSGFCLVVEVLVGAGRVFDSHRMGVWGVFISLLGLL